MKWNIARDSVLRITVARWNFQRRYKRPKDDDRIEKFLRRLSNALQNSNLKLIQIVTSSKKFQTTSLKFIVNLSQKKSLAIWHGSSRTSLLHPKTFKCVSWEISVQPYVNLLLFLLHASKVDFAFTCCSEIRVVRSLVCRKRQKKITAISGNWLQKYLKEIRKEMRIN